MSKLKGFAKDRSRINVGQNIEVIFHRAELQIYGVPAPITQDFIKWRTTFQGNSPVGRILFGCK